MSKNYLGHLESRNTKYQGQIQANKRNGLGIMIDNFMLFCLSHWKNEEPNGPTFIAFPRQQLFFGQVQNCSPTGLCCYSPAKEYQIYCKYIPNEQITSFAVYYPQHKTIYEMSRDLDNKDELVILNTYHCSSTADIWDKIGKVVGVQVAQEYRKYHKYISKNLQSKQNGLECCVGTQKFIGYHSVQTLGIKFDSQDRIKAVGNFKQANQTLLLGKKYQKNATGQLIVTQGVFTNPPETYNYVYTDQRPAQLTKVFQQNFKRSTAFENKFNKMITIDNIHKQFSALTKCINHCLSEKFGQITLESGQQQQENKIYSLEEIKAEIYRLAGKKVDNKNFRNTTERSYRNVSTIGGTPALQRREYLFRDNQTDLLALQRSRSNSRSRSRSGSGRKYKYIEQENPRQIIRNKPSKNNNYTSEFTLQPNEKYTQRSHFPNTRRVLAERQQYYPIDRYQPPLMEKTYAFQQPFDTPLGAIYQRQNPLMNSSPIMNEYGMMNSQLHRRLIHAQQIDLLNNFQFKKYAHRAKFDYNYDQAKKNENSPIKRINQKQPSHIQHAPDRERVGIRRNPIFNNRDQPLDSNMRTPNKTQIEKSPIKPFNAKRKFHYLN